VSSTLLAETVGVAGWEAVPRYDRCHSDQGCDQIN